MLNPLTDLFINSELDVSECKVKDFEVKPSSFDEVKEFIIYWHYSHKLKGMIQKYVFKLVYEGQIIGAMIYGQPAMPKAWMKYGEKKEDVLELRRLCCIDKTPKNTESYFIGKTLRWLKKNTDVKTIVSYADPHYGHGGTIYKASNFAYWGTGSPSKHIEYGGQLYHDKYIRNVTERDENGKPIKYAKKAQELIDALESGEAKWVNTPAKHIYVYPLR
jgi:hypothetical protein